MSLGDWFSVSTDYLWCEQKGLEREEVGWYIHQKGENSMAVSEFGCKSFRRVISPTLSANGQKKTTYLTSYKPPRNVQVRCISYSWLALPKQLDHKCALSD